MSESSLLKCPHEEGSEMYPLHDLITHLESCPSTCQDGGSGEGEDANETNCDHLARYEESVSKLWVDKTCPHRSCSKALSNPQIVPRHLEECLEFCDSLEDGQCTHLNDFDAVLLDVFKMPVDGCVLPLQAVCACRLTWTDGVWCAAQVQRTPMQHPVVRRTG